jgi:hypothetical protein
MIAVTVGSGSSLNSTGNDFVDEVGRTLSGFLLEDIDNDGDGGTPLAVATVSDSDGSSTYVGAPPGAYTVVEANSPGLVGVTDSHGEDPNVITIDLSTGESPDLTFVDELTSRAPTTPSSFPILSTDTLSTAVYTFVYIFVGFLLGILFVKCWTWRHHESETKKRLAGETEGTDKSEELVRQSKPESEGIEKTSPQEGKDSKQSSAAVEASQPGTEESMTDANRRKDRAVDTQVQQAQNSPPPVQEGYVVEPHQETDGSRISSAESSLPDKEEDGNNVVLPTAEDNLGNQVSPAVALVPEKDGYVHEGETVAPNEVNGKVSQSQKALRRLA